MEKQLNGTHPNRLLPRLLAALLDKNRAVFTLEHLDGIVLLDQSPTLVPIHAEILRAISSRVPIHQLCYSGSHRLGMHGWLLEDIPPVKTLDDLPEWIPPHPIGSQDPDVLSIESMSVKMEIPCSIRSHSIPGYRFRYRRYCNCSSEWCRITSQPSRSTQGSWPSFTESYNSSQR